MGKVVSLPPRPKQTDADRTLARSGPGCPYTRSPGPTLTPSKFIPLRSSEDGSLPIYTLAPERIRYLPEEEVGRRNREDERAARYRAMYDDLGLRVVAHPDGTLEASWRFGEAALHKGSDASKNKHATKHFHATNHPIVQSFQPGEDWRWCYIDEVLV